MIAFGAAVEYKPSSDRGRAQLPKFGDKLLKGIFVGYKTHSGGLWSGDLAIVDVADLSKADKASQVPIRYFKAAEILPVKRNGSFVFPLQDGSVLQPTHEVLQWNDNAWVEDVKAWDEADKDEEPAYVKPVSDVPDHKYVPPSAKSTPRAGVGGESALDRASKSKFPPIRLQIRG